MMTPSGSPSARCAPRNPAPPVITTLTTASPSPAGGAVCSDLRMHALSTRCAHGQGHIGGRLFCGRTASHDCAGCLVRRSSSIASSTRRARRSRAGSAGGSWRAAPSMASNRLAAGTRATAATSARPRRPAGDRGDQRAQTLAAESVVWPRDKRVPAFRGADQALGVQQLDRVGGGGGGDTPLLADPRDRGQHRARRKLAAVDAFA